MKKSTQSLEAKKNSQIERDWHLIDLNGQTLGRVMTQIAKLLQGKNKVNYVPNLDMGDHVVVINAEKVSLTGKKETTKFYTRYSGYPGGQKKLPFLATLKKNPADVVRHAVSGMLPKNKLRSQRLTRLHIFRDAAHPYTDKFKNQ